MVGIGGADRGGRRGTVISACVTGVVLAILLLSFALMAGNGPNIAGNISSPPSMVALRNH
jgi:hypothetical protein